MRSKIKIFILLLLFSISSPAQETDNCNCLLNLKEIIDDIETNYPGYPAKSTQETLDCYIKIKETALSEARKTQEREACFYIISGYLDYFKDNHIIFTDRSTNPTMVPETELSNSISDIEDPLSGIWHKTDGSVSVKIVNTGENRYAGRIINEDNPHDPDEATKIYFELFGDQERFKIRKFKSWLTTDLLRGRMLGNILIEPEGIWKKSSHSEEVLSLDTSLMAQNDRFKYYLIDDNNYYLGIPAFDSDIVMFDSLLLNKIIPDIVENEADHLIIDLRNNVGGNSSFLSLLRLTFDKPFSIPGDYIYASPAMIRRYQKAATEGSQHHEALLPKLMGNRGDFVQRDSMHIKLAEQLKYPRKISVIVNDNCASSTEYFLILARHSEKVKIFGRPTAGTLDYSELHRPEDLPCKDYIFMRPTTKAFFTDDAPIDNIGIRPDVDLSQHPDYKWVEIILEFIKTTP